MSTKEEKDIVEIKGEIGRIRHHLDLQKKTNEDVSNSLVRIENALIGSKMNGDSGLVKEVRDLQLVTRSLNEKIIQYGVYFMILGTVTVLCLSGLISLIIKMFNK